MRMKSYQGTSNSFCDDALPLLLRLGFLPLGLRPTVGVTASEVKRLRGSTSTGWSASGLGDRNTPTYPHGFAFWTPRRDAHRGREAAAAYCERERQMLQRRSAAHPGDAHTDLKEADAFFVRNDTTLSTPRVADEHWPAGLRGSKQRRRSAGPSDPPTARAPLHATHLWRSRARPGGGGKGGQQRPKPGSIRDAPLSRYGSQLGQDAAVLELFAPVISARARHITPPSLFFIETGANSPLLFSNTVRLEDSGAWHGLCVDASKQSLKEFHTFARSCEFVHAALGVEQAGNSHLYREIRTTPGVTQPQWMWLHGASGLVGNQSSRTKFGTGSLSVAELRAVGATVQHQRTQLTSLKRLLDQRNAPQVIDYFSLDVEGVEEMVLNGLWPEGARRGDEGKGSSHESLRRGENQGSQKAYKVAVLSIERPSVACKVIMTRAGLQFNRSMSDFGEELWVHPTLLAERLRSANLNRQQRTWVVEPTRIPNTLQFTCRMDAQAGGACIGQCPVHVEAERCRRMCAQREACRSFLTNVYRECYLKTGGFRTDIEDPEHQTVACSKLTGPSSKWRKTTWPYSLFYRLGDIFTCSYRSYRDLFFCGALDVVNVQRLWPGSLAAEYLDHLQGIAATKQETLLQTHDRVKLFSRVVSQRLEAPTQCTFRRSRSSCVLHVRVGDIFRNCSELDGAGPEKRNLGKVTRSKDCTLHSARGLWEGDGHGGRARGQTFGEKKILPRAYFEHALREMPNSTKVVILVHAAPSTLIDKEYLELLRAFIISHGLEVIGTPWKPSHDGLDYQQTDCDLLFMSSSSCFVPSGGGFSGLVSKVVRHLGGRVLPQGHTQTGLRFT